MVKVQFLSVIFEEARILNFFFFLPRVTARCIDSSKVNLGVGADVCRTLVSCVCVSSTGQVRHLVLFYFYSRHWVSQCKRLYDCSLVSWPPSCSVAGLDLSTDNRVLKRCPPLHGQNRLARPALGKRPQIKRIFFLKFHCPLYEIPLPEIGCACSFSFFFSFAPPASAAYSPPSSHTLWLSQSARGACIHRISFPPCGFKCIMYLHHISNSRSFVSDGL